MKRGLYDDDDQLVNICDVLLLFILQLLLLRCVYPRCRDYRYNTLQFYSACKWKSE